MTKRCPLISAATRAGHTTAAAGSAPASPSPVPKMKPPTTPKSETEAIKAAKSLPLQGKGN